MAGEPDAHGGALMAAVAVAPPAAGTRSDRRRVARWRLGAPFLLLHAALLTIILTGWSRVALAVALVSYVARAFGITAFYHRCFAHRAFKVPRAVQFLGALLGASAAQRGPLWWVAHHRKHHLYTDKPGDPHSPVVDGFWYSHVLWIFDPQNAPTDLKRAGDLARFPELRFLDRYEYVAPAGWAVGCFGLGELLSRLAPGLGTSGWQMLTWGFVVPTIALYHSTFSVNSLAHRFGRRRYETSDDSRNNWVIAALVLGEGWHNNHHRFPNSARQGLSRSELDPTWWGIRALAWLRLASNLRPPPRWALEDARPRALVGSVPGRGADPAWPRGQSSDGRHQPVAATAGVDIGTQAVGVRLVSDSGAPQEDS